MMERALKAAKLFADGYNCAQAVAVAFSDLTGLSPETSAKITSSFGGGMGRMGEVCGAVSGMLAVAGLLYGYGNPDEGEAKKNHYALVREMAEQFREQTGSILCRELLAKECRWQADPELDAIVSKRPCARLVALAAHVLEQYIQDNSL